MTAAKPVALITGASSGIGAAAATALVDAGFEVVGTSRRAAGLTTAGGVPLIGLDVTREVSVTGAVALVMERFGRIDLLVNNAGIGASGAAEDSSVDLDRRLFDVNVFGVMRVTKTVLPHMRAQRSGRIVNVSSVLGLIRQPYMAAYASTKWAIEGWTESLDHEVRPSTASVLWSSSRPGPTPDSRPMPSMSTNRFMHTQPSGRHSPIIWAMRSSAAMPRLWPPPRSSGRRKTPSPSSGTQRAGASRRSAWRAATCPDPPLTHRSESSTASHAEGPLVVEVEGSLRCVLTQALQKVRGRFAQHPMPI